LAPDDEDDHGSIESSDKLWAAVKTVIIADLVMSIDNVIAIAGAAETAGGDHKIPLVIFGLLVSIPIIVWGSQLVIKLMERFPFIIVLGGMLLGWIAGGMIVTDPAVLPHLLEVGAKTAPDWITYSASAGGAALVFVVGQFIKKTRKSTAPAA
jgi:predicted tellurium resistance membrane protein TerC